MLCFLCLTLHSLFHKIQHGDFISVRAFPGSNAKTFPAQIFQRFFGFGSFGCMGVLKIM